MIKKGFTLAEVLITLAIIGVVAAISIPSVVANTQQKEFQTGLRKAVSVLNSAITMNMALDGESPYENKNLYQYLGRHMSVLKTMVVPPIAADEDYPNASFYTTDGMRFEVPYEGHTGLRRMKLHENPDLRLRGGVTSYGWSSEVGERSLTYTGDSNGRDYAAMCGSYGLANNTDSTVNTPCIVVVDVNGDRKPFPKNATCFGRNSQQTCAKDNVRKYGDPDGIKVTDTFSIMITDKQAVPFGVAAQKAMYQAQGKGNK